MGRLNDVDKPGSVSSWVARQAESPPAARGGGGAGLSSMGWLSGAGLLSGVGAWAD